MSLKEKLFQYNDIIEEIKVLETKLKNYEEKSKENIVDVVDSTTKNFPVIQIHKKVYGKDINLAKKIELYKEMLKERYQKLLEVQIEVEQFINEIPTSRLRRVFEYRYINKYSWVKIASLMGNGATSDSIKKEHYRYLEKFK